MKRKTKQARIREDLHMYLKIEAMKRRKTLSVLLDEVAIIWLKSQAIDIGEEIVDKSQVQNGKTDN